MRIVCKWELSFGFDDCIVCEFYRSEGQPHVILVERYANGTAKRSLLDTFLSLLFANKKFRFFFFFLWTF